jgi:hypothetical protein
MFLERLQKVEYELFVAIKEKETLQQSIQEVEEKASTSSSSMSTYEETNKRLRIDVTNLEVRSCVNYMQSTHHSDFDEPVELAGEHM